MNATFDFVAALESAGWVESLEVKTYDPILELVVNGVELAYTPTVLRPADFPELIDLARVQVATADD